MNLPFWPLSFNLSNMLAEMLTIFFPTKVLQDWELKSNLCAPLMVNSWIIAAENIIVLVKQL